jgi:hypothetical protein
MANEASYAAYLSSGGRVARVLRAKLHDLLYDKVGLRGLMSRLENGNGSATLNTTKIARGMVLAAASTEISGGFSNTLPTTTNFDCTTARYGGVIQPSDFFHITSVDGLNVEYLLSILMETLELTLTDLLVALFANVAGNVGTSGADLTTDDWFDAIYYLNLQNNPGIGIVGVLHNQQVNDLIESARGETGPMQFRMDAQGLLVPPGTGFRGQFAGVTIIQSDSVVSTGADRRGCMFSEGAFAYRLESVSRMLDGQMINPADILFGSDEMFIERDRDGANALSSLIVNAYPGTAEQEDLRAVRITTDA